MPNHGLNNLPFDLFIMYSLLSVTLSILTKTKTPPPWVNRGPADHTEGTTPQSPCVSQLIGFYGKGWDAGSVLFPCLSVVKSGGGAGVCVRLRGPV